jgi:uncharacterized protein (DUF1330 family)
VMDKYADISRSPRSSPGVVNRVAEIQRRLDLATESRRLGCIWLRRCIRRSSHPFRSRGGKVFGRAHSAKGRVAREENKMNKITLLAGIAIGVVLTAGVAQLQAQAPAPGAATTRNAVFVITLQTITDQARYEKEFQQQATKTIKDNGGRFVVRNDQVTSLAGEAPKRIVITGWESLDDVKKWQAGEYKTLLATRDQVMKVQQFAVYTCENPQGAKPGQTKCP